MGGKSRIIFSDLKRIVNKMRCQGMSEVEVMRNVVYVLDDINMVGDE